MGPSRSRTTAPVTSPLRVGLILPHGKFVVHNPAMASFLEDAPESFRPWMIPSCGLLTVAALSPPGVEHEYVDEQVHVVDFDRPYDIVAISGMTQHASRAYEIAHEFKRRGVYTIMGGPHATVASEEALDHVDTVVKGEAEGAWEEFIRDFQAGTPKRLYSNVDLKKVDVAASPLPRFDLLGDDYFERGSGYRMMPVQTTRGCPRSCEFCSVPQIYGKTFRTKTVDQVVREVEEATRVAGNQLVLFADDNMFLKRRFSKELLRRLIPMKIRYMAQSDIGIARDEELLDLMYASGCMMVLVGLESLSLKNLKQVDAFKAKMLDSYEESVKKIQDHGMIVLGAFIVGLDNDDASVFNRIRDFVHETHVTPQITIATPLPGTAMTERIREDGRLPEECYWDRCTYYDSVYEPVGISSAELEEGIGALHRELFASPAVAGRRGHLRRILKRLPKRYLEPSTQVLPMVSTTRPRPTAVAAQLGAD
jgi:radical SAM superfamily enzyme YgiQ (UPF0313 family)